MGNRSKLEPAFWSSLILILSQALTLYLAFREKDYVEAYRIISPQVSLTIPLVYFFVAVIVLGIILFFIPIARLKIALKIMFAILFSWGIFIFLGLSLPILAASVISIAGGSVWFLSPRIWLHNLLLLLALVSVGTVFGFILSPWAAMSLLLVLSVYDFLAVRFGYMLWLADKLSQSEVLPAFIIPRQISRWNLALNKADFKKLFEGSSSEREFSILGGGDIGFPLLLMVSVFFAYGFASSLIVAGFSLLGLISAYWIQLVFLKGKPMPALPPISFLSLIGFLIVLLI